MGYVIGLATGDATIFELRENESLHEGTSRLDITPVDDTVYRTREDAEGKVEARWSPKGGFFRAGDRLME